MKIELFPFVNLAPKKKKEKKSAHSIILGNFWPDHEKLKMKFLLP